MKLTPLVISSSFLLQLLNEFSEHEVDLYESADYIGGHTHTVNYKSESPSLLMG